MSEDIHNADSIEEAEKIIADRQARGLPLPGMIAVRSASSMPDPRDAARFALHELVQAIEAVQIGDDSDVIAHARLVLALNAARNVLNREPKS